MGGKKKEILFFCVASYTVSYLCRTNLSLVLDSLIQEIQITKMEAGFIGTVYFWCYAIGQLISGPIAEKKNPKTLITFGLGFSACSNLLIGMTQNYFLILFLWALNGISLSFVWTPTVKIASNWFKEEEYNKISILLSLPTTLGYLISWGGIGIIIHFFHWRMAFFIPAVITFIFLTIWVHKMKEKPDAEVKNVNIKKKETEVSSGKIFSGMLVIFGIIMFTQGSVRESINLWAPSLLSELGEGIHPAILSFGMMLIPIAGTVGILFTGFLVKKFRNLEEKALLGLLLLGTIFAGMLFLFHEKFAMVINMISLLMAVLNGITVILTVLVPLKFSKYGKSAVISGILNFLAYAGASFGGVISGTIVEQSGWKGVYLSWEVIMILAVLLMIFLRRTNNKSNNRKASG